MLSAGGDTKQPEDPKPKPNQGGSEDDGRKKHQRAEDVEVSDEAKKDIFRLCPAYLKDKEDELERRQTRDPIDACIIVSKNEIEFTHVISALKPLDGEEKIWRCWIDSVWFYVGRIEGVEKQEDGSATTSFNAVLAQCGQGSSETADGRGSRKVAEICIQTWKTTKFLVTLGMAFGSPSHAMPEAVQHAASANRKLQLVDVLVANRLIPGNHMRQGESSRESEFRDPSVAAFASDVGSFLTSAKRKFEASNTCRRHIIGTTGDDQRSKVHIGTMLSSDTLLDDLKKQKELIELATGGPGHTKPPIGGEMEGHGMIEALVNNKATLKYPVLVIKGDSDFADGTKAKALQGVATDAAVEFFRYLLDEVPARYMRRDGHAWTVCSSRARHTGDLMFFVFCHVCPCLCQCCMHCCHFVSTV